MFHVEENGGGQALGDKKRTGGDRPVFVIDQWSYATGSSVPVTMGHVQ